MLQKADVDGWFGSGGNSAGSAKDWSSDIPGAQTLPKNPDLDDNDQDDKYDDDEKRQQL